MTDTKENAPESRGSSNNRALALKLAAVSVAMFAFGFAMVPIYDVFCELTGLNGKTGRVDAVQAAQDGVDEDRLVAVELLAGVNRSLNLDFHPAVDKLRVHPGAVQTVTYHVTNNTARKLIAQAVPSVAPLKAGNYFNKVECFCFEEQAFAPGETRELPVSFVVAPGLPADVKTISLAYTFFDVTRTASADGA